MQNKIILAMALFIHCSVVLFSQITSGELSFVRIDSFTNEYDFNDVRGISAFKDSIISASLYRREDTTIQIVNGNYEIKIINRFTDKDLYENSRDSFAVEFNENYIISDTRYNVVRIYNLNSKAATNYSVVNNKFDIINTLRMYEDFREIGEIVEFKTDKKDIKIIAGVEGYKIEYKEKFKYFTKIVKMYVCEDIKYPIKLFVNFPEDLKICPIYIEQHNENTQRNKSIIQLLSVKKVPKKLVSNKVNKVIKG